ncbi:MAG: hypothetical protein ACI9QQ_000984 [Myxococcota bacterium]|jgi:hypothetical protein
MLASASRSAHSIMEAVWIEMTRSVRTAQTQRDLGRWFCSKNVR